MLNDVRYALRALRGTPVFTAMAILTLTLGIGATTTLFTVALAACLVPARRAVQVEPVIALRHE